ncbi:MAG TPA: glutathione S-transferase N-terminal domain-containing protein [Baekduia sp.]|nr:glutathione S-transferase N-terminal domain-containing protein [Baekduia sp.]
MAKVKLHRCSWTFVKLDGHPCWRVQKALDEKGVDYEVVKHGFGRSRQRVEELSGQPTLPVLELPEGEVYRAESKEMAERIRAGSIAV